ncbi:hypothetical protein QBC39DRAFT_166608 [Podospora conica]|nr:hypothetical protein QBC39DRAFT_166608 [Schizothecium conicum]
MTDVQSHPIPGAKPQDHRVNLTIPPSSITMPPQCSVTTRLRSRLGLDTFSPVNQNGSFEFDRVIKSGYVHKRTSKTKAWRTIYLVLRPNTLSIYKSDKEEKLRHKVYLSDLTAVTLLKDPKNKRPHVFGLFSPSKNFHLQAPSQAEAQEWVDLIRKDARIEEEEEEMFLASPAVQRNSFLDHHPPRTEPRRGAIPEFDRLASSSPEPAPRPRIRPTMTGPGRRPSQIESSGMSGAELASHSDFSDSDAHRFPGASIESLAELPRDSSTHARPGTAPLNRSQDHLDPDRVMWQGWLGFLRSKGGVRKWKKTWAVLRPRNLILYKDDAESSVLFLVYLSSIVNVVDIDPMSRTRKHCLQIITDEKSYKFCAKDEEGLVQCLGAFKSLLAKRRELEAKAAAEGRVV